jgi:biopolymer transport protein ExbD
VSLAIAADGALFWNGEAVDRRALRERLSSASKRQPQPEIHLRADRAARYQSIAEVMADAANAGLGRIGFVSEPEERSE